MIAFDCTIAQNIFSVIHCCINRLYMALIMDFHAIRRTLTSLVTISSIITLVSALDSRGSALFFDIIMLTFAVGSFRTTSAHYIVRSASQEAGRHVTFTETKSRGVGFWGLFLAYVLFNMGCRILPGWLLLGVSVVWYGRMRWEEEEEEYAAWAGQLTRQTEM